MNFATPQVIEVITRFKLHMFIGEQEYLITVTRNDCPHMGGHTEYKYKFPKDFPMAFKVFVLEHVEGLSLESIMANY